MTDRGVDPKKGGGKESIKDQSPNEEDWVEYVDSLGRTRYCLKEELPEMMKRDRQLRTSPVQHSER